MVKKQDDFKETETDLGGDTLEDSSVSEKSEENEKANDVNDILDNGKPKKEKTIEVKKETPKEDSWNFNEDESPKSSFGWKLVSAILLVLLVASIYSNGFNFTGASVTGTDGITLEEAESKVLDYVNDYLLSPPFSATIASSEELADMFLISLEVAGQTIDSYLTKDGKLFFPQGFDLTQEPTTGLPDETEELKEASVDDDPMKGNSDAPVTIIEFSEYQCPYCKKYVDETYPQLVKDYVDTGKVRYVFRDFPLGFHSEAKPAAMAAECAHEQGKYWEYHDKLFANQNQLSADNYKKWAAELGLDTTKFDACLASEKYSDEVEADILDGQSYGVSGTPAFFVNGVMISGAQPYSVFKQVIEKALSEAGSETTKETTTSDESDLEDTTETLPSETTAEEKEFQITAKKWRFDPNRITVNQGDKVKLMVTAEDIYLNFVLSDFQLMKEILDGNTETFEFVADEIGTFEFNCGSYCTNRYGDVQGSALKGELVVE